VVIVIVLIALVLTGKEEISPGEQTATAVIQTNTAVAVALNATGTAVEIAAFATQDAIRTQEFNATQTEIALQTVQAQQTLDAANTVTAEFNGSQTAMALTATQDALDATATQYYLIDHMLTGRILAEDNTPLGNVRLLLHRDNGNRVFEGGTGDQFIDTIITGPDGSFDFGVLEPGDYWIEIDYDSLPPDLQALIPPPTEGPILLLASVPAESRLEFSVFPGPSPTASPTALSPIDQTATVVMLRTLTPGYIPPTISPTVTPTPTIPTDTPEPTSIPTSTQSSTPSPTTTPFGGENGGPRASATPSSTPSPRATESPTPMPIAEAMLRIRDISGNLIGDGTLRLFAPSTIEYPHLARIEFDLRLDHRFVTLTPIPMNITPVTRITTTPRPEQPTFTPRVPIYEESGQEIYERMGASLVCPPGDFEGCDSGAQQKNFRSVGGGATWTWNIKPPLEISGLLDFRVELWTLELVEEIEVPEIRWSHTFQIEVNPSVQTAKDNGDGLDLLEIAQAVSLVIVLVGSVAILTMLVKRKPSRPYIRIFISYQRRTGWTMARTLRDRLATAGADVFIDVVSLNEGRFATVIEKAIIERDHFVVVLAPGTLDSEWVRREVATAIRHQKNVVPVLIDGFEFDDSVTLPDDIKDLPSYNAVKFDPEFFEAAFERLTRFVKLKDRAR
jgi:hypothetical protein